MNSRKPLNCRNLVLIVSTALVIQVALSAERSSVVFEGKDTLVRPENYREWIFAGSTLGLDYNKEIDAKERSADLDFKNVYITPEAYRSYSQTGEFPQRTVLVLEIATAETKKKSGLQGTFQKKIVGLSAAVKDRSRFETEWAYFDFTEGPGTFKETAQPLPKKSCYSCHREKGEHDNVFTQFYPALRETSKK